MNYTCWVGLTYTCAGLAWQVSTCTYTHTRAHMHTHTHTHTQCCTHMAGDGGYDYDLIVIGGGSGGLACCKEGGALAVPPPPTPLLLPTFSFSYLSPSRLFSLLPPPFHLYSLLPLLSSISHSSLSFFHFPSFLPSLPLDLVPDYSELLPSFIPFFLNGTYVTLFYSTSAASFGKRVAVLDFVAPSPQGM